MHQIKSDEELLQGWNIISKEIVVIKSNFFLGNHEYSCLKK